MLLYLSLIISLFWDVIRGADVEPVAYHTGIVPQLENLLPYRNDEAIHLSPARPLLVLDYGTETAGFPFIQLASFNGSVQQPQLEFRYSEQWDGLNQVYADGPLPFAVGLSNTFRTETFSVGHQGTVEAFLLQGGLRWQSIRLLTNSTITIKKVAIRSTVPTLELGELPGKFVSSNEQYTKIWDLGARTMQSLCLEAGSQPSTWELTDEGMLIRGQQTAQSAKGLRGFGNYTLTFFSKIVRGGLGWRVAVQSNIPYGPYFVLTSEYPVESTFVNTNTTLLPANSLVFGYGYSLVNLSTLTSGPVQTYLLPIKVSENVWHTIATAITSEGYQITINDTHVATIPYVEPVELSTVVGAWTPTDGTWGFGPFKDQVAYFKDVTVVASNGTSLYSNQMKSSEALAEYGVHANYHSFCSDGAKRDRLVWIGDDFLHGIRTIGASTHRLNFAIGTIQTAFDWQPTSGLNKGLIAINAPMGSPSTYKDLFDVYGFRDWMVFFLIHVGEYYKLSDDLSTPQQYWSQVTQLVQALLQSIDPYSGLMAGNELYVFPEGNGTSPSSLMVWGLRGLVPIAEALADDANARVWSAHADRISEAVNKLLWNPTLKTYSISLTQPGNYSILSVSLPILAGIANVTQMEGAIHSVEALRLGPAIKDANTVANGNRTQLSPNTNGFLLEALFIANQTHGIPTLHLAESVLIDFWSLMVTQDRYYTGTTWEYLFPDGSPGIVLYTSHSHEWGTAPTHILTKYVLGVTALAPGFKRWIVRPSVVGLDMKSCQGVAPTPHGSIHASWSISADSRFVNIQAQGPQNTIGRLEVRLPNITCNAGGKSVLCDDVTTDESGFFNVTVQLR